jgi:dephospho-CoA kinase
MPVFGLTGPNASGKGAVSSYLASKGFAIHSLSDVIREELAARGEPPTRERMIRTGNALRRAGGAGVLAERLLARLGDRDVVDSVRNPSEVEVLRRVPGFRLVHVDAPAALRFERSRRRGRAGDADTLEAFLELENQENSTDPTAQQLAATAALADLGILNDADIESLHAQVDRLLRLAV